MNSYRMQELLHKLSHHTISTAEEEALRQLTPEDLQALLPDAKEETPPSPEEMENSTRALAAVWRQLKPPAPVLRVRWWAVAASIAAVIILSALLFSPRVKHVQQTVWEQTSTPKGERRMLTLKDGTVIYLNGNTILRYPSTFNDTVRQLELVTGEMFLEVQPDKAKPFRVQTGTASVEVLGTSFGVHSKPGDRISVAVKTGKVAFRVSDAAPVLLTPGKMGIFTKSTGTTQLTACDPANVDGWMRGEFEFENVTLRQILAAMEDRYGFRYTIQQPALANKRLRAAFKGQKPEEMIRILSKMADFNYIIKDSTIIIP